MSKISEANFKVQGNFYPGADGPFDARTKVDTLSDLTNPNSWKEDSDNTTDATLYNGMVVSIGDSGDVYVLKDKANVTSLSSWKKVGSDVPKKQHELIYSDDDTTLTTKPFMYDSLYVVENQDEYDQCKGDVAKPSLTEDWIQFSQSPYSPEYGTGLSTQNNKHKGAVGSGTAGMGYGTWEVDPTKPNIINTVKNSDEYNGYMTSYKRKRFNFVSVIGDYGNNANTSGDLEGIALVNTSNAIPRNVVDTNGDTYYRNTLYDLDGTVSGNEAYCAWVCTKNNQKFVIYSQPTSVTANDARYYKCNSYDSTTQKCTFETTDKFYNFTSEGISLTSLYNDTFPTGTVQLYQIVDSTTLAKRRVRTNLETTVTIASTHEASGYVAVLNVVTENTTDINSMFSYGQRGYNGKSSVGTVFVYSEILSISKDSDKSLFGFLRTYKNQTSNIPPVDSYGMQPLCNERRHFITVGYNDTPYASGTTAYTTSKTSGNKLVPYVESFNQCTTHNKPTAVMSKCLYNDGVLTLNFSNVCRGVDIGSTDWRTQFDSPADYLKDSTSNPIALNQSELVIDFNNKKYSMKDYDGNEVTSGLEDLVVYKDNLTTENGDSVSTLTGGVYDYSVPVYRNGSWGTADICSLFTGELQFMYFTTSLQYHALSCEGISFEDRILLRTDNDEVWVYDATVRDYVKRTDITGRDYFTGSRMSYNDVTKKLWYSNGHGIYQVADVGDATPVQMDYLPLSGGTMTGDISFSGAAGKGIVFDAYGNGLKADSTGNVTLSAYQKMTVSAGSGQDLELKSGTSLLKVDSSGAHCSLGFFQDSDLRKKDVHGELPLDKAYDLVDKCSTILYTLKDDESHKEQIGLIAQEVEEFFPEIVATNREGFKSLDYSKLTVILLRVLKDLIGRVDKLERKETVYV